MTVDSVVLRAVVTMDRSGLSPGIVAFVLSSFGFAWICTGLYWTGALAASEERKKRFTSEVSCCVIACTRTCITSSRYRKRHNVITVCSPQTMA